MATGRLATAFVDIQANLNPLHSGLSQARTAIASFARGSGGKIPLTIALGATGASLGGLVAGLGDAALKAAKLQEALSKVKITFGEEAGGVLANVDALSEKFGVSKREAADAAAEFGLLAKAAGMSAYEQARFSKEFNQIATDLASFHVTTRPDAIQKLMSGLEGMSRPLRQFGIFIDDAKVKAEASALGMRKHNEELTDEQKILVRSILIRKQAGIALGDAERSLARPFEQIKKFWGDLENAQAEFGKHLQGALIQAIGLARDMGEEFSKVAGSPKEIGETIESIIKVARFLNKPIEIEPRKVLTDKIGELALPLRKLFSGFTFPKSIFPTSAKESGFVNPMDLTSTKKLQEEAAKRQEELVRAMQEPNLGPATPEEFRQMWLKAAEEMDPAVRKAGADFVFKVQNKLTDWIALHLKPATDPFGEFKANMQSLGHAIGPLFKGAGAGGLFAGMGAAMAGFMGKEGPAFEKMKQDRALELLGLKKTTQSSQMFAEPEDFMRQAITGVLSNEPQKEHIKILTEVRDEIKEGGKNVIDAMGNAVRALGRVFPRG